MNNEELKIFITWIENKIVDTKLILSYAAHEDQDDELNYTYHQGELNALLLVQDKLNTL